MEYGLGVPFDKNLSRQQGEGGAALTTFLSLDPTVSLVLQMKGRERKYLHRLLIPLLTATRPPAQRTHSVLNTASHLLTLSLPFEYSTRC